MPSSPKCPFCLKTMIDALRHIDTHAESHNLTLFVFDTVYHLTEDEGGYRCPLCTTAALPFQLYVHLQSHFALEISVDDQTSTSPETDGSCGPHPSKKRKQMSENPASQHDDLVVFESQPQPSPPVLPPSTLPETTKSRNPFLKRSLNQSTGSTLLQTQHRRSIQPISAEEPTTPTPKPHLHTPPSSLVPNHHRSQQHSLPDTIKSLRTNLKVSLSSQCPVVSSFLNSHKGACMAHTLLGRSPLHPHNSLKYCDLMFWVGSPEYNSFRSSFRSSNNPGRCASCGCPKIDGIDHQGSWDGGARLCKDEDLQEWVLGLAYYIWELPLLRDKIFELLGIPFDPFRSHEDGRSQFAAWLGQKNGRDLSWTASNLLDFLFVVASNTNDIFGKF